MKKELVKYLLDRDTLTTLIGRRLRGHQASQGDSLPYIIYQRAPEVNHHHHMLAAAGLVSEFYHFDVYSMSMENVETIAEELRQALDGFRGDMNGENVRSIHIDDEDDEIPPIV